MHSSSSRWTDAAYARELRRACQRNLANRAEVVEKVMRRATPDACDRSQNALRRRDPWLPVLLVGDDWIPSRAAPRDSREPESRIGLVVAADDPDAMFHHSQQGSTDRVLRNWTCIDRPPFDEQICLPCGGTEIAQLPPQAPLSERQTKVQDGLPLDQARAGRVITNHKMSNNDGEPKCFKPLRNSRATFMNVDGDRWRCASSQDEPASHAICALFFSEREKE